jgi:hypothetical protein
LIAKRRIKFGLLKGKFTVPDEFDAPNSDPLVKLRDRFDRRFAAMQTPQAKAGVRALFRATPKELERTSVTGATERHIDAIVEKAHRAVVDALGLSDEQAAQVDPALLLVLYHWAGKAWPGDGVGWLRRPNTAPFFGGQTPIQKVLQGEVRAVIDHLKACYWVW